MTTVAIIQARMTSSRLPGKVLMDMAGQPSLTRMLDRVRRSGSIQDIVVATTVNATDDPVAALAASRGVRVSRGSEQNVLERFTAAAREAGATTAVRLTADCPMIDPGVIDACVALFERSGVDYASNVNRRTYPDGLDVEVFSMDALAKTNREVGNHARLREHVTIYMRGKFPDLPQGEFTRADLVFDADFGHVRWTVDYPEDLERLRVFFTELSEPFTWLDALALATRKPWLLGITPS
jgi:spore coat polysaccharide biosynthesis protein SpsF (cytidylyltransferase family)